MNIKKKILLSLTFIAGMFFTGLYGVNFSKDYLTASELMFDPQARFGQNVNVVGVVEYEASRCLPI